MKRKFLLFKSFYLSFSQFNFPTRITFYLSFSQFNFPTLELRTQDREHHYIYKLYIIFFSPHTPHIFNRLLTMREHNQTQPIFPTYYWIVQKAQWQSSFLLSITASCTSSSIVFKIPAAAAIPIVPSPFLIESIGTNVSDATSNCSWKNVR